MKEMEGDAPPERTASGALATSHQRGRQWAQPRQAEAAASLSAAASRSMVPNVASRAATVEPTCAV